MYILHGICSKDKMNYQKKKKSPIVLVIILLVMIPIF